MIQFNGNEETVHFANWCLLSDSIDIGKIIAQAEKEAVENDIPISSALGDLLEDEFDGVFFNLFNGCIPYETDWLHGEYEAGAKPDEHDLIAPIAAWACRAIDFYDAARLILAESLKTGVMVELEQAVADGYVEKRVINGETQYRLTPSGAE